MNLKRKLKQGGFTTLKKIIQSEGRPVGLINGKKVDVRYYDLTNVSPSAELAKYCEENSISYNELLVDSPRFRKIAKEGGYKNQFLALIGSLNKEGYLKKGTSKFGVDIVRQ